MRAKAKPVRPLGVPLLETLAPELATLVAAPPTLLEDWIFEDKFDGYRMLARLDAGDVRVFSRNGLDWTSKLTSRQNDIARSGLLDGWYDGEIVVLDDNGRPNFGLLQNAFDRLNADKVIFYVFDAPYLEGEDLRELALVDRRERVRAAMEQATTEMLRFSGKIDAPPAEVMVAACQLGLEGLQHDIEKEIKSRQEGKLEKARQQILAIAQEAGISIDELLATGTKKPNKGKGQKVRAQYRNPADNAQIWTGRGRQPRWIGEGIAGGKILANFRI